MFQTYKVCSPEVKAIKSKFIIFLTSKDIGGRNFGFCFAYSVEDSVSIEVCYDYLKFSKDIDTVFIIEENRSNSRDVPF